eukprot:14193386-Alexandrium_andersonii.AAC.1
MFVSVREHGLHAGLPPDLRESAQKHWPRMRVAFARPPDAVFAQDAIPGNLVSSFQYFIVCRLASASAPSPEPRAMAGGRAVLAAAALC